MKTKPTPRRVVTGTALVKKYRPRLNQLTATERDHLLERAMQLAYGKTSDTAAPRRR